jgi:NifU-like protein involved in Fe-S cluster formation
MTSISGDYSELVRRYFANPDHAGHLPDDCNESIEVEAAESESGARVVLSALVVDDTVQSLRYQIFGCPHLIAAAEAFCHDTEGRPAAALGDIDVPQLMERLAIPVEKTGRLFILEDAARALHIKWNRIQSKED